MKQLLPLHRNTGGYKTLLKHSTLPARAGKPPVLVLESQPRSHCPTLNMCNVPRALGEQGPIPWAGGRGNPAQWGFIVCASLGAELPWGAPSGGTAGGWGWTRRSLKCKNLACWKTRTWRCLHCSSSQRHRVILYQYYLKFRSIPVFNKLWEKGCFFNKRQRHKTQPMALIMINHSQSVVLML